jgi:sec-independent protein translocase protein TatA
MTPLTPLFGPVGPELVLILVIFLLLFGAKFIPGLARSLGESITQFQAGRKESKQELEQLQENE